MGKKGKIAGWITGNNEQGSSGVRRENEQLCSELESVQQEYKKFRILVEQLHREYAESKEYELFRRYGKLKGMIKRTINHLRLSDGPDSGNNLSGTGGLLQMCRGYARNKEGSVAATKMEERYKDFSDEALSVKNAEIQSQIADINRRTGIIKNLIHEMDDRYESSKRYMAVQRYRLMKGMIKEVIHSQYLR